MTSAAKTNDRLRGFTLIEIVIVLVIAGIVVSGAVAMMVYSSDERVLKNASGEIEVMAKRARMNAILKQTPYAIEFREGVVRLMPLAMAGRDERSERGRRRAPDASSVPAGVEEQFVLENGMTIAVRRWNSDQWFTTFKDVVHIWRFDPNGLSEPLSIRITKDKNWMIDTFHPLTASICDSQLETQ